MITETCTLYEDSLMIEADDSEFEHDDIEFEDFNTPNYDPRFDALSPETRGYIDSTFSGDLDEAIYCAYRQMNFANPPAWAIELVGPRKGWHDPLGFWSAR